jgi:hypothetical protein
MRLPRPESISSCLLLVVVGCSGASASFGSPDLASDVPNGPSSDGGLAHDLAATGATPSSDLAASGGVPSDLAMNSAPADLAVSGAPADLAVSGAPADLTVGGTSPSDLATTVPSGSDGGWRTISSIGEPARRSNHSAVWTGTKMLVWGGQSVAKGGAALNTGGLYDPSSDSWTATSTSGAPSGRIDNVAVWTGQELLVWGGDTGVPNYTLLGDGARYDPATDQWAPISTVGAPTPRANACAVWTGSDLLVWSGQYPGGYANVANGARYRPSEDRWYPISQQSAPLDGQTATTAVWTGSEMFVWVGDTPADPAVGGRYDPALDQWYPMTTTAEPSQRYHAQAIWTGSDVIVWGGKPEEVNVPFEIGERYRPASDSWLPIATDGEPDSRIYFVSAWTGTKLIVWGGQELDYGLSAGGSVYDPLLDTWTALPLPDDYGLINQQRSLASGIYTGSELLIWGGLTTYDEMILPGLRYPL